MLLKYFVYIFLGQIKHQEYLEKKEHDERWSGQIKHQESVFYLYLMFHAYAVRFHMAENLKKFVKYFEN